MRGFPLRFQGIGVFFRSLEKKDKNTVSECHPLAFTWDVGHYTRVLCDRNLTMIRTLTEQATKHLRFRRRLPEDFGGQPMWVSPSAGLRYLFKPMAQVDPSLLRFVSRYVKKGDVVWDIGANIGLFTLTAAYKAGLVVAVEPDESASNLLKRSCQDLSVALISSAVGNSVGVRSLHLAKRSNSANFLEGYGTTQTGGTREVVRVHTVTLDWIAQKFPLPDVLKIDVEGAEVEVFEGCSFLSTKRPIILCEVSSENSPRITEILHRYGYQLFDGDLDEPISQAAWNTVAVPYGVRNP